MAGWQTVFTMWELVRHRPCQSFQVRGGHRMDICHRGADCRLRAAARCRLQGFTLGYVSLWEAVGDRVQGSNPFTQGLRGTSCLTADKSRVAMGTLRLNSALAEDQRRAGDFITKVCSAKSSGEQQWGSGWVGEMCTWNYPVTRVIKKNKNKNNTNNKLIIKIILSIWYIFVEVWMHHQQQPIF